MASGTPKNGAYMKIWFNEEVAPEETIFDANTSLLMSDTALALKTGGPHDLAKIETEHEVAIPSNGVEAPIEHESHEQVSVTIKGCVPPEMWNRVGTRIISKVKQASGLKVSVEITLDMKRSEALALKREVEQVHTEMGLSGRVTLLID